MKKNNRLTKLYLLVITIPRGKKEIINDMMSRFDVTICLSTLARGSKDLELTKDMMFCIIKENQVKDAILALEDKFINFKNKTSMAYAIPLNNIIGVSNYMTLTNGGIK